MDVICIRFRKAFDNISHGIIVWQYDLYETAVMQVQNWLKWHVHGVIFNRSLSWESPTELPGTYQSSDYSDLEYKAEEMKV